MTSQPLIDDDGRPLPTFGFLNAHNAFRRDLPRFARAADRLERGDLDVDALDDLRRHWFAYRTFLEQHHGFEDAALFPAVAERDPALKAVIEDLAAQHDELHDLLPEISELLDGADQPGTATRLRAAFASLGKLLEAHLATEERELLGSISAAIRDGAIQPPGDDGADEPTEPPVPADYGVPFTVEHLDPELRAIAFALFPSPPDPVLAESWLAAYGAHLARWAG